MSAENSKHTFYSLIVGINDYQYVGKLGGCVADATNVNAYFSRTINEDEFDYKPLVLTDSAATKQGIIDGFMNHLSKARAGDIALFYFSGHGAQEDAPEAFAKHEEDNLLETIVCYDSRNGTVYDIADKELRYLIHYIAKNDAHVVSISDSCHSGKNTREDLLARLTHKGKYRGWTDFCFHDVIAESAIKEATHLDDILPQGKHIQIASCKDSELAYEKNGSGIFTSMFLDILSKTKGEISYKDLHKRIEKYVSGRTKAVSQHPQIYSVADIDDAIINQRFLGGAYLNEDQLGNILFTRNDKWTLDLGSIHGIPASGEVDITVIDDAGNELTKAYVTEVLQGMSYVRFEDTLQVTKRKAYKAKIEGLMAHTLNIYLEGDKEGLDIFKAINDSIEEQNVGKSVEKWEFTNLNFVENPELSDYALLADGGYYVLTKVLGEGPIDRYSIVPVVEQVKGYIEDSCKMVLYNLAHIAKWEYLRNLENPNTEIFPNPPIEFTYHFTDAHRQIQVLEVNEDNEVIIDVKPRGAKVGILRIQIENTSFNPFHCCLLALADDFFITPRLLPGTVFELQPGMKTWSIAIPLKLEQYQLDYNIEYIDLRIKLIASTQHFDADIFSQKKLRPPNKRFKSSGNTRGSFDFDDSGYPNTEDWTTHLIKLKMKNGYFKGA